MVRSKDEVGEEEAFLKNSRRNDRRRDMYRREYPLGRIIGQPGRKQRERSETLRIPSMQQPFDVVVLQDVKSPEVSSVPDSAKSNADTKDNAKRSVGAMISLDEQATEEEVNASIEELRPVTHTLDQRAYDELRRKMLRSYNRNQLSSYLKKAHPLSLSNNSNTNELAEKGPSRESRIKRSVWRPGQSPLEFRHFMGPKQVKGRSGRGGKQIVDEILNSAWNLVIESDDSQIGELEMLLKRWQIMYLFDIHRNKRPNYEQMVQSPLLLRNSKIERHQNDNAVRITARRVVAEQIASVIETKLFELGCMDLNLSVFGPVLQTPGRPLQLNELFSNSDLRSVAQQTMCVIERRDEKTLSIHGASETERHDAMRFLLSLIPLPAPTYISRINLTEEEDEGKLNGVAVNELQALPEVNLATLPLRYRAKRLSRVVTPTIKLGDVGSDLSSILGRSGHRSFDTRILEELSRVDIPPAFVLRGSQRSEDRELDHLKQHDQWSNDNYWTALADQSTATWEAQLCRLLQPYYTDERGRPALQDTQMTTVHDQARDRSIVQSHIPGLSTLLSYFSPERPRFAFDEPAPMPPVLIARFIPSPFTNRGLEGLRTLPRIELRYDLMDDRRYSGTISNSLSLRLSGMRAIVAVQDLRIPLPDETADLRFVRRFSLDARIDHALRDSEIQRFTRGVQQSLSSDAGALIGTPAIKFKLPALLAAEDEGKSRALALRDDVEVQYLFERFEQIQTADFMPLQTEDIAATSNDGMQRMLEEMTKTTALQYRAIEGGVIGGSRTELALRGQGQRTGSMQSEQSALVKTSLDLVHCLTRINAGRLLPSCVPKRK